MNILRSSLFRRGVIGFIGSSAVAGGISYLYAKRQSVRMERQGATNPDDYPCSLDQVNERRSKYQYKSRDQHVKEIESTEEFDVVIIGGGCTGAGIALNTSAAGLKTLLVDSYDFSAGTSSKSTKLLHGGIFNLREATGTSSRYSTSTSDWNKRKRTTPW